MSITERPGQLGGQDVFLRQDQDAPYVRSKVPVTPQRSDVEGDSSGVVPDPLLRYWTQADFSAGGGFPLWDSAKDGYDYSDGVVWDESNEWLTRGPRLAVDDSFTDGGPFYVRQQRVVTSGNGGTDKLSIGTSDATPTWATDGFSVKAANTPTTVGLASESANVRVFSTYANGDLYQNAALWKAFGAVYPVAVAFRDNVYVLTATTLDVMDGFLATATSTTKVNTPYNQLHTAAGNYSHLTASDVGPCWLVQTPDDRFTLWEYNVADDTSDEVAVLPKGAVAKSVLFEYDGYWVPYLEYSGTGTASVWLWYLVNGVQGRVGPFKNPGNASFLEVPVALGRTDQNEIIVRWETQVWAYNVETTGLHMIIDTTDEAVSGSTGVDYGFAHGDVIVLTHDNGKVAVYPRSSQSYDAAGGVKNIYLGAWDGGYPGVQKRLAWVSVSTAPLAAGTSVRLIYRFDDSTSYSLIPEWHEVDGEVTYTWYPDTYSGNTAGDLVHLVLRLESSGNFNRGPFVRKVSAAVVPDVSHVEWQLLIDLGDDRSGRLDSKVTADWLWGLPNLTSFVDPWSVRESDAAESHTVRIIERVLGPVGRDGPQYARLRLRSVETV